MSAESGDEHRHAIAPHLLDDEDPEDSEADASLRQSRRHQPADSKRSTGRAAASAYVPDSDFGEFNDAVAEQHRQTISAAVESAKGAQRQCAWTTLVTVLACAVCALLLLALYTINSNVQASQQSSQLVQASVAELTALVKAKLATAP